MSKLVREVCESAGGHCWFPEKDLGAHVTEYLGENCVMMSGDVHERTCRHCGTVQQREVPNWKNVVEVC